ncbi:unnamed protein product [Knipowitschia caucasica]|uniref:Arachidonate 15-lipoxygenase B-like n=1 Tax=Knipowitschia caucasica TaxID=637954 RepID=A0AAV2LLS0_KNICA
MDAMQVPVHRYTVRVFTGRLEYASTFNNVYIKLVGEQGLSSTRTLLKGDDRFPRGSKSSFSVAVHGTPGLMADDPLGDLILVELDKQPLRLFPVDSWFVEKVEVTSPMGRIFTFPMYHWIDDVKVHFFREGKAVKVFEELNILAKESRRMELQDRQREYCWHTYAEGIPHCIKADKPEHLPDEVRFAFTKATEFEWNSKQGLCEMKLSHLDKNGKPWTDFDSIERVFSCHATASSEYVRAHWKEDAFFGYQFLNGINPILIQRCSSLPSNLPLTEEMVRLEGGATLTDEMQRGNIFLCDYKILDGVKPNVVNSKEQYLAAPLVLFHNTPENELKPIAIQLKQTPSSDNPIFFPSDPEYDWILAKTYVRSADFNYHELNVHLLRTHLLAEAFSMSLLRNVPRVHPLYKLLVPHTRYTLQINLLARNLLISELGVLTRFAAAGWEGMMTILQRSLAAVTYRSLCIHDNIQERGMESVPNYYYRDDGLQLWDIIHRFVAGVINHYYKLDTDIQQDTELQAYIQDIFEHGFLSKTESGIPQSFNTVGELVKFVTMVIFTSSAQHSAVNSGQISFGNWMPNFPSTLQLPPPTVKGNVTENTLLMILPDVNATVNILATLKLLSTQSTVDFVAIGQYPQELFTEDYCRFLIEKFQKELADLDAVIDMRNAKLKFPYTSMGPKFMENSVSL